MDDKGYMVVCCRNKSEVTTADNIKEKFEDDCDVVLFFERKMIRPRHRKSAALVESECPVYPGYLFVWISPHRFWMELKACRYVYGVLSHDGVPTRVPKERLVPYLPARRLSPTGLSPGTIVKVFAGPFEGLIGTFIKNGSVELNMFGRVTRVSVASSLLQRVDT